MKLHSKPVDEHVEVPLADDGRWEDIVARFTQREATTTGAADSGNACYVLSIARPGASGLVSGQLAEIKGLVEAQGDTVVGEATHVLLRRDARTLIGPGVAQRIGQQARNLEHATSLPICDREAVILNVFERHATTRRARVQVEIAHLEYLRPRIRGIGLDMDQQAGGVMGGRGPGETASELLARRLDGRLAELRRALKQLTRSHAAQRSHRVACARIALVGYTNAGKTSLMNALTDAGLSTRDRPFETLDTTSRCLTRHGGDILLSDTVGFIRRLPERLLASFESTLAELCEASLLLWVLDISDPELSQQLATTRGVLDRLGAASIPRVLVFNKLDRRTTPPSDAELASLADGHPYVALSSRDAPAVTRLRESILSTVRARDPMREVFVRYERSDLVREIYASCRVRSTHATERGTQFVIEGPAHVIDCISRESKRRTK